MSDIITRYYNTIFIVILSLIILISYYLGTLKPSSNGTKNNSNVTLNCSEEILSSLKIPLSDISNNSKSTYSKDITNRDQFLGSKNGTKYYTPGCVGSKRINDENIIWFQNEEDAKLQGYTAAKC